MALVSTIDVTSWRELAACIDKTELFFTEADKPSTTAAAKAICAGCPVRDECLLYALEINARTGIWGGKTPRERSRLRRRWLQEFAEAS